VIFSVTTDFGGGRFAPAPIGVDVRARGTDCKPFSNESGRGRSNWIILFPSRRSVSTSCL
jgi:hypothetical protein